MSRRAEPAEAGPAGVVRVAVVAGRDHRVRARRALAEALAIPAAELELDHDAQGRPVITRPRTSTVVSIAHAPDLTLVAFAPHGDVGVDVEPLDRNVLGWALWRHVLTRRELERLPSVPRERNAALLRLWVRKEALLKAVGTGIAVEPSGIELTKDGEVVALPPRLGAVEDWALHDVEIPGCAAAVACRPVASGSRVEVVATTA